MSIAEEFKLKEIPKTKGWYAPNRRRFVKTKSGKVQVRKVAVKIGLKTNNVAKRAKHISKMEATQAKKQKREEAIREYDKKREEVMLWTFREALDYLAKHSASAESRLGCVINNIVVGKFENDEG